MTHGRRAIRRHQNPAVSCRPFSAQRQKRWWALAIPWCKLGAASKSHCSMDTKEATHPINLAWSELSLRSHNQLTLCTLKCNSDTFLLIHLSLIVYFLGPCSDSDLWNTIGLNDFQVGSAGSTLLSQLGRGDLHSSYLAGNMQSCSRYSLFLIIW